MRIEIPMLPPQELNPNWKGSWQAKAKATRRYKDAAYYCACQERNRWLQGHEKAEVSITLVIPDKRYIMDEDNAIASLKPAIDGCKLARVIEDDSPDKLTIKTPINYEFDVLRNVRTILEFKEVQ